MHNGGALVSALVTTGPPSVAHDPMVKGSGWLGGRQSALWLGQCCFWHWREQYTTRLQRLHRESLTPPVAPFEHVTHEVLRGGEGGQADMGDRDASTGSGAGGTDIEGQRLGQAKDGSR
jgi:hypothetical protein